mmetsp:Transcript_91822/g.236949  ORF Transcript_91822/g.236949 Transcript_91822/m.236949 type:complete len:206 (+) Transcript_91822:144-761(+)
MVPLLWCDQRLFHGGVDGVGQPAQPSEDHDHHQEQLRHGRPDAAEGKGLVLKAQRQAARAVGGEQLEQHLEKAEVAVDPVAVGGRVLCRFCERVFLQHKDQEQDDRQVSDVLNQDPARLALQRVVTFEDFLLDAFDASGNVQIMPSDASNGGGEAHDHDCRHRGQVHHHCQEEGCALRELSYVDRVQARSPARDRLEERVPELLA